MGLAHAIPLAVLAFLLWHDRQVKTARVDMRICGGCEDCVYVPLGVIVRCPTCKRLGVWK